MKKILKYCQELTYVRYEKVVDLNVGANNVVSSSVNESGFLFKPYNYSLYSKWHAYIINHKPTSSISKTTKYQRKVITNYSLQLETKRPATILLY